MAKLPDYGLDAPAYFWSFAILGGGALAAWIVLHLALPSLGLSAVLAVGLGGSFAATVFYISSKRLKLRERDRLLESIRWRGDEQVLDVGCGRGLLLIGAAKRLTSGKAYGIDIWRTRDQSGNSPEATRANAVAERVTDRVEIQDADARRLPFYDGFFDVVVSSIVIHNINGREERGSALSEMARVLKPGGHLAITDILHVGEYARELRRLGMVDVRHERRLPLFLTPFGRVRARKA